MVKTTPSNAGGVGLIPGEEAKIPHALWPKNQNIKDGRNKPAISVIKETINGLTSIIKKTVNLDFLILKSNYRDFPGSPMVAKTPRSQCREPGFDPWSGN